MARNRYLLPGFGLAAVALACLAALLLERPIPRVPRDLVAHTGEFLWRRDGTVAFTDGTGRTLTLPSEGTLVIGHQAETVSMPVGHAEGAVLGVTPDGDALTLDMALPGPLPKDRRLTLTSRGVAENTHTERSWFLTLEPTVEQVEDVLLSPDGSQLAWQWTTVRERLGVGLLRRFSSALAERFPPRRQVEVWLSDTRGGHLRQVATAPFTTPSNLVIGWSPQSKTLVIRYHSKDYQLR